MRYIDFDMNYGHIYLNIEPLLKKKGISKNTICHFMNIPRTNFNKYCRNEFQRIDRELLAKLCFFLECSPAELFTYEAPVSEDSAVSAENAADATGDNGEVTGIGSQTGTNIGEGIEESIDAGVDAGVEESIDASVDVGTDAGVDAEVDKNTDPSSALSNASSKQRLLDCVAEHSSYNE